MPLDATIKFTTDAPTGVLGGAPQGYCPKVECEFGIWFYPVRPGQYRGYLTVDGSNLHARYEVLATAVDASSYLLTPSTSSSP